MNYHHIYVRDFPSDSALYAECLKYHNLGFVVLIHGYYSMDCKEFKPHKEHKTF